MLRTDYRNLAIGSSISGAILYPVSSRTSLQAIFSIRSLRSTIPAQSSYVTADEAGTAKTKLCYDHHAKTLTSTVH